MSILKPEPPKFNPEGIKCVGHIGKYRIVVGDEHLVKDGDCYLFINDSEDPIRCTLMKAPTTMATFKDGSASIMPKGISVMECSLQFLQDILS